jgi:AraC-like DNA-binding protein
LTMQWSKPSSWKNMTVGSVEPLFQTGLRDQATERIVNLLVEEMESGGPSGRMYAESLVRALVCRYLVLACDAPVQRTTAGILHPKLLKRLHEWMLCKLHEDISLAALADEANYSPTVLLRAFRASHRSDSASVFVGIEGCAGRESAAEERLSSHRRGKPMRLLKPGPFHAYFQSPPRNHAGAIPAPPFCALSMTSLT